MTALLSVSNLDVAYNTSKGWAPVLNGISFDVCREEIVGIVGESGSGKSTAIRSILGLLPNNSDISSGSALFDGQDLIALPDRKLRSIRGSRIGFIAQNPFSSLNPVLRLSVQFAEIFKAHGRRFGAAERAKAIEMLASTGIHEPERVLNGYAFELSGGMAQRVVISMAMILDPELVIADEPTTALDLTVQRQVLDVIRTLTRAHGRSALIVTHDLGVVANYCDRVIVMLHGRIVEEGLVSDVFVSPQDPYTRSLLASMRADEVVEGVSHGVR